MNFSLSAFKYFIEKYYELTRKSIFSLSDVCCTEFISHMLSFPIIAKTLTFTMSSYFFVEGILRRTRTFLTIFSTYRHSSSLLLPTSFIAKDSTLMEFILTSSASKAVNSLQIILAFKKRGVFNCSSKNVSVESLQLYRSKCK